MSRTPEFCSFRFDCPTYLCDDSECASSIWWFNLCFTVVRFLLLSSWCFSYTVTFCFPMYTDVIVYSFICNKGMFVLNAAIAIQNFHDCCSQCIHILLSLSSM
ncbi:hypothetical protein KFK09_025048 [Dendrobium nobile]|uniref:Uncharacterized protein n=1 Tax=Dendrobium nobile TaxID=94219 RepID=A0A8T3AGL2_DENNO|nr:hypothetical protein KFK09_025048 [Dendrobium nobile]